ncbi:MFS transporter [Burkholderia sp. ABCPW 11]|uniref:MFS transporter n=1 Tax=Burkholderia sp. ABCPW 11 TaxID=1637859 RepID=UPI00075C78DC|nr:MFS transporter [Burkholderia sp. ABCPW 11]KVD46831.1 MFS transporter [Burkholderia sp. ABCPW 11]
MNARTAPDHAGDAAERTPEERSRNALKGAFFSEFVDMFDVFLPIAILSPVLFLFLPPSASGAASTPLASLAFVVTLLGRPVGALLFGVVADRVGRRRASIWSTAGFSVFTLLIAVLPGYETIGAAAYWLLVLCRFIDGIFLGGGYTGAVPLAFEYAKKARRGFVGGLIIAGFPTAYLTTNLLAVLMLTIAPLGGHDSPYARWGWRVPFVFGGILAALLTLYYVYKVEESRVWHDETTRASKSVPLSDLFSGASAFPLLQVFVMMTGFWLTQNLITIYLPMGLLAGALKLDHIHVNLILVLTYSVMSLTYVGAGVLSQRIGRRLFFIAIGLVIATAGAALLFALSNAGRMPFVWVALLVCLLAVIVTSPWGVILTYINERFITDVRATGFGVGFSFSIIAPSFYAYYMHWLDAVLSPGFAPSVLMCVGGVIGAIGATIGPETRDVEF